MRHTNLSRVLRRSSLGLVAALALGLGACRSDGGFGRADNAHTIEFTRSTLANQMQLDLDNTIDTVSGAPGALWDSFALSGQRIANTYDLYIDATTENH